MEAKIVVTSNNSQDFDPTFLQTNCPEINFSPSQFCFEQSTTDINKIANLTEAFAADNQIILAMRGGSGATRLMAHLTDIPQPTIKKQFVGYSDLTVLLNYFNKFDNIDLIHGPMAFELTTTKRIEKFKQALNKVDVKFEKPAKWYNHHHLEGQVIGGNLMLLTDMLGTFYEPDFENKILLIEEIDEPIDKLDRMFAQLRDSGKLFEVTGIILGNFKNCASEEELLTLFDSYLKELEIGILYDVNLGHIDDSDYIHLYTDLIIDQGGITYKA